MVAAVSLLALGLARFRNHRATRIEPGSARFVVLAGANGAGKTNILEAVSLLAVGRGLRGAALADMQQGGKGGFSIHASLAPDRGLPPLALATSVAPDAPGRRLLRVNGAPAPLSVLSDWSAQLWLTPAMDGLFSDAASARRRFLDRLVLALFPAHAGNASRYLAAMRARTRLLSGDGDGDPHWLDGLELQMAEHGAALAAARRATIRSLAAALAEEADSAFPRPTVAIAPDGIDDAAAFADCLRAARGADRLAGRATLGPHRADLLVCHAATAMPAAQSSTGEQKALLLSILLAHAGLVAARTGRAPLLLLDEVGAHLDPDRRAALFGRLRLLGGQAWMTGTDGHLFDGLDAARIRVRNGSVEEAG